MPNNTIFQSGLEWGRQVTTLASNKVMELIEQYIPVGWLRSVAFLFLSGLLIYIGLKITNKVLKAILWILGGILIVGWIVNLIPIG